MSELKTTVQKLQYFLIVAQKKLQNKTVPGTQEVI